MRGLFYDVNEGFCVRGNELVLAGSQVLELVSRRAIEVFVHILAKDLTGFGHLLQSFLFARRLILELLISHTLVVLFQLY